MHRNVSTPTSHTSPESPSNSAHAGATLDDPILFAVRILGGFKLNFSPLNLFKYWSYDRRTTVVRLLLSVIEQNASGVAWAPDLDRR